MAFDASSAGSTDSWELPDVGDDEERVYMFKRIGLTRETLLLFDRSGYRQWTSAAGGGIAETSEGVWGQIGVPPGEQEILRAALQCVRAGTFRERYLLPRGSMSIPRQTFVPQDASPGQQETIKRNIFQAKWDEVDRLVDRMVQMIVTPDLVHFVKTAILPIMLLIFIIAVIFALTAAPAAPVVVAVATGDCLPGDAHVLVPGRKQVCIRDLVPGDGVVSYFKKRTRVCRILDITKRTVASTSMCRIKLASGTSIAATTNHAFWVDGRKWGAVDPRGQGVHRLQRGDQLVDFLGNACEVHSIEGAVDANTVQVFNLVLEGHGSYFVNGFLTHSGMKAAANKENLGVPSNKSA